MENKSMQESPAALTPPTDNPYASDPLGHYLEFLLNKREQGTRIVGLYCNYAPVELIRAMDAVPVSLCSSSRRTIPAAEEILPANLCPMIKSSFGYIRTNTCLLYEISDAVIGETTCDGKKKMFELIAHLKPTHIMDLPQLPDEAGALDRWVETVGRLKTFLEREFKASITEDRIEAEILETNKKNRIINHFFDSVACHPPLAHWREIYDVIGLDSFLKSERLQFVIERILQRLAERAAEGIRFGNDRSPRVLVTGCPIGGDAAKVLQIIDEAGGVIAGLEACGGMKGYCIEIEEGTGDPLRAVAEATLKIPCSCMTPNRRRLDVLDEMVARFKPDAVVDVVLHACHAYNIESLKILRHMKDRHGLPGLKIETDYSDGDVERIRTRVEALFECL
ncbi:MAG: 2-hydroxyacyl-CoA dehydratase [Deltaproteobacteria bacterium HGW-Deltaproteobacteria-19]|jgi:benzoyl-CoA reductase/2-hydroxyglutaryl-CoA dehydratase subunit BcrC/BadD/HgdB|nr:MAG: 2-hydroxyacyl-CoA dehydratase [Deltaproteobacteria bacterium HGW-Deltaproteobacteria-19]